MSTHAIRFAHVFSMLVILAACSLSNTAQAETTATKAGTGDYEYRFRDEDLLGGTLTSVGDIFKSRAGAPRVLLVRPRTAFVAHLLKSVEDL